MGILWKRFLTATCLAKVKSIAIANRPEIDGLLTAEAALLFSGPCHFIWANIPNRAVHS